jgi:hypothetical protein
MQLSGSFAKESEEAGGAWSVEDGTPVLLEDFEGFEFIFVTEIADAKALELCMLAISESETT